MDCCIIVFAKAPIPGKVKTRLLPYMSAQTSALLHEKLVLHCLKTAVESGVGHVELWCSPSTGYNFFTQCEKMFPIKLYSQVEGNLGERMAHAFKEALKRTPLVLLMGTDCPALSHHDLKEAKETLNRGIPVVISPAEDGGYVLIGLREYEERLFEGISWGTESVLEETRERIKILGWRWRELPRRWDVDRPEDVERLRMEGFGHLLPF